jgi:hypothetical protein
MTKRTTALMVVLVLVIAGGLFALRLAGPSAAPAPAITQRATPPAATPPPAAPPRATPPPAPAPAVTPAREPDRDLLEGSVLDGMTHEGIANAELTFLGDTGVSTFFTGRDGQFALAPPPTGSLQLASIAAPGFLPYSHPVGFSSARVTLARGQAVHGLTLLLYPATDYEGTVVDARDAPVAGARVRLLGPPGDPGLESPQEWRTDAAGRFIFQAATGAVLEASRDGRRAWGNVDRNVAIMKRLTIHLGHAAPRDATITGWVRDAAGAPLADAQVRAAPSAYYSSAPIVVATTSSDGRFTLAGVDRGSYDMSAEAADHLPAVRDGVHGGSRNVELRLDAGLAITGQVVDEWDDPVPVYTLIVQRQVGLARAAVATVSVTDPRGQFAVRVAGGHYDLTAAAPQQPRTTVEAAAGASHVRIVIGKGRILRGKVISRDDGAPIADAFVGPERASSGADRQAVIPMTATGADGAFELAGLSSGTLALEVSARGYAQKVYELPPASADGTRGPITIELSPGGRERRHEGELSGIGVQLRRDADALVIVEVMPGSGARDAGLDAGDRIIAIEGAPVAPLEIDAAVAQIRGPAGTSVTLTLRRGSSDRQVVVERRQLRS